MQRFILFALLPFALPQPAAAQDHAFDLSGTVRLRYEAIDDQARAGFNRSDDLFNIRTTLLATWHSGPVRIAAELWDSRVYGGDTGTPITTGEVNTLEPVQAYAAVDIANPIGANSKLMVQAGRFLLNLGARRLVAADDYRNTTNGYTGIRTDLVAPGGVQATAIYVLPQHRRPDAPDDLRRNAVALDREGFDLVLWGGVASKAKAFGHTTIEASYFHLGERDTPGRPTRNRSLDTLGGRVIRDPALGTLDYEVEGFYQFGRIRTSTAASAAWQDVRAWFVHADLGHSFPGAWKPRVSIEYDQASGDRAGGSYGRFDTLFGMRRADLAPAGLYNAIARFNIATPGARVEITPDKAIDAFASYHALFLASATDSFSTTGVRDASGRAGSFGGHQIDARVRWWLRPQTLRLELDGVLLAKGRFLRDAPNAPPGRLTRYGSVNLTASF